MAKSKKRTASPLPDSDLKSKKKAKKSEEKAKESEKKVKESEKKASSKKKAKQPEKKEPKSATASSNAADSKHVDRFPVQIIHRMLEEKFTNGPVKKEASVFLTAILEYLSIEILEMASNVARNRSSNQAGSLKVTLGDTLEGIESDTEMKELIVRVKKLISEAEK